MLNYIWLALVLLAVAIGGWNDRWKEVTDGAFDGAKTAVTIALGLIGVMALWLGVMRLAERAGLVQKLARALRPIMRRLFPDVPAEHPAMGAMLMNMAANMLGLGNAATPLGLRAMRDLGFVIGSHSVNHIDCAAEDEVTFVKLKYDDMLAKIAANCSASSLFPPSMRAISSRRALPLTSRN